MGRRRVQVQVQAGRAKAGATVAAKVTVGLVAAAAALVGCTDAATPEARPARGSIGEETFGVLCDRIGAQALPEDLTGASFRRVCHRDVSGAFADAIDDATLPNAAPDAVPATVAYARSHARARLAALARHRTALIAALDAMFPADVTVSTRDGASDACGAAGSRPLGDELARFLARMATAYDDGTVPEATRGLGRLMQAIEASPDAQGALARLAARDGYRPEDVALGIARPLVAYPRLRELGNTALRAMSPDASAPGAAYAPLRGLVEAAGLELQSASVTTTGPLPPASDEAAPGLPRIARPRTKIEIATELLTHDDPAFGTGAPPRWIVRRDGRGMAQAARPGGAIAAPFVDLDGDGLADLGPDGAFVTRDGRPAPTPFVAPLTDGAVTPRTPDGRALASAGGPLLFAYVDSHETYAATVLRHLKPLVNADPLAHHETLMDALAGAYVLAGARDGAATTTRAYPGLGAVTYDAYRADHSPLVDLVYAAGQLAGDANVDASLALGGWAMQNREADLAQATAAALHVKSVLDGHPEAALPATSALWDDLVDVLGKIAAVRDADGAPGLLQGVLEGLGDDAAQNLGPLLASFLTNRDEVDYDRRDVNGPPVNVSTGVKNGPLATPVTRTLADQGYARSIFQRFLQLVHDTKGVSVCNREGAKIKALFTVPGLGTKVDVSIPDSPLVRGFWGKDAFGECEVFKIDDMASFYVTAIAGKAEYVLRDKQLRDGVQIKIPGLPTLDVGVTATTVKLLEDSSDITGFQPPGTTDPAARTGFWTGPTSHTLLTRPQWLNRNLFFPNGFGDVPKPARAKAFSDALNPDHAGTSACRKRMVKDPLPPSDPNATKGGIIALPDCDDGEWLDQRDAHTIFALEVSGFYDAIAPLVRPFVDRGRADLLVELLDALHRHWADEKGDASECRLGPVGTPGCTKDGAVHAEPVLADAFGGELVPALRSLVRALNPNDASQAPTFFLPCAARDAAGACTGAAVRGTRALAFTMAAALDPEAAAKRGLRDRAGAKTSPRRDGGVHPQVTPALLVKEAVHGMDEAFDAWAAAHGGDDRRALWTRARSQLVDQFLTATNAGGAYRFDDVALPRIAPIALTLLRQQLWAHCQKDWPAGACTWATQDLPADAADAVSGPIFAHAADLLDALRADPTSRIELEKLATYLLDSASDGEALANLLATSTDGLQVLEDDRNLVPLYHAIGAALTSKGTDASSRSLVDGALALVTRLTAKASGPDGTELCGRELDPNQILTPILRASVTPRAFPDGRTLAPIEAILDAIADVNRAAPEDTGPFGGTDYGSVAHEVKDFLLDEQRGLEQFYAIVRNATRP